MQLVPRGRVKTTGIAMFPSDGNSAAGRTWQPNDNTAAAPAPGETAATAQDGAFVTSITDIDIVLGRGRFLIQRPGNVAFRELCRTRKDDYLRAANRNVKDQIARELIEEVVQRKGRFLRKIETPDELRELGVPENVDEAWKVVDFSVALEKTKQTLRDKEYVKTGVRDPKRTSTTSDNSSVDNVPADNPMAPQRLTVEAAAVSEPTSLQRQVSRATSSSGHESRSASGGHLQRGNTQPTASSTDESLLLLSLQQEQNRIRQVQQQLAHLQYQEQLRHSAAISGLMPSGASRFFEQELLRLRSRQAVAPQQFPPPNYPYFSGPDYSPNTQPLAQILHPHMQGFPMSVDAAQRQWEEMLRGPQHQQRPPPEQKTESKPPEQDPELHSNILLGRDRPPHFSPRQSSQLLQQQGFPSSTMVDQQQQQWLEMQQRQRPMDPQSTVGHRFSSSTALHQMGAASVAVAVAAAASQSPAAQSESASAMATTPTLNNNPMHPQMPFLSSLPAAMYQGVNPGADPALLSLILQQRILPLSGSTFFNAPLPVSRDHDPPPPPPLQAVPPPPVVTAAAAVVPPTTATTKKSSLPSLPALSSSQGIPTHPASASSSSSSSSLSVSSSSSGDTVEEQELRDAKPSAAKRRKQT